MNVWINGWMKPKYEQYELQKDDILDYLTPLNVDIFIPIDSNQRTNFSNIANTILQGMDNVKPLPEMLKE